MKDDLSHGLAVCKSVAQAVSCEADSPLQIHEDFAIPDSQSLRITVHGFSVPGCSPVSLLRDNDRLQVFPAEAQPSMLPAALGQQQPLQLTMGPAAAGAAALASQSRPRVKRGKPDPPIPSEAQHRASAVSDGQRAAEPPAHAAEAAPASLLQQPLQNGAADSSSGVHAHMLLPVAMHTHKQTMLRMLHPVPREQLRARQAHSSAAQTHQRARRRGLLAGARGGRS